MFTGLVEEVGSVVRLGAGGMHSLEVSAGGVLEGTNVGDSVAVNGVCLTVNGLIGGGALAFSVMPETLRRTALGYLSEGDLVNLERAMSLERRFGGHMVQGHVDGVGEIVNVKGDGEAEIWEFKAPQSVLRYTVEKGSVCVDGISLTVVSVRDSSFTTSILPQTRAKTNLRGLSQGARVNLEADIVAKYVERFVGPRRVGEVPSLERSVEDAV